MHKIRGSREIENKQKMEDFEIKIDIKLDSDRGNRFSEKF